MDILKRFNKLRDQFNERLTYIPAGIPVMKLTGKRLARNIEACSPKHLLVQPKYNVKS